MGGLTLRKRRTVGIGQRKPGKTYKSPKKRTQAERMKGR